MTAVNNIIINGMSFALPLFIMAIGGIYSERSGITNLALEGLQGMGAFTGALVAYCLIRSMGGTSQVPYYRAMLFAMIGGAVYSMLHAALCIKFKANQVISGVVVNILAECQFAGGFCATLKGRDAHEILLHGDGDGVRHFSKERNNALEYADQNRALAAIVFRDLRTDFTDALMDLFLRNKNTLNVLHHVKGINHSDWYPLSLFL